MSNSKGSDFVNSNSMYCKKYRKINNLREKYNNFISFCISLFFLKIFKFLI